jgi:hypothetical protein
VASEVKFGNSPSLKNRSQQDEKPAAIVRLKKLGKSSNF